MGIKNNKCVGLAWRIVGGNHIDTGAKHIVAAPIVAVDIADVAAGKHRHLLVLFKEEEGRRKEEEAKTLC
jgi:hypothetical protein